MLALDLSLARIEAAESDVLDLFVSPPFPITLPGSVLAPHSAHVCAVKREGHVQVYVALAPENGRCFIYTDSDFSEGQHHYRAGMEQALEMVRSMGFAPERVSLDYGPAMKAVVIRNYRIFDFSKGAGSGSTPRLKVEKESAPALANELPAEALDQPVVELAIHVAPVAPAAAGDSPLASPCAAPKVSDSDRHERDVYADLIVKFATEMAALRVERDALLARSQQFSTAHLVTVAELKAAKAEHGKLIAERDSLAHSALALESVPSELAAARKDLAVLARECEEAQKRIAALVAECAALAEKAARSGEEVARVEALAARTQEEVVSAQAAAAKAQEETVKAHEEWTKAQEESVKAREESAKAQEELARAREESARAREEVATVEQEAAKAREESARAQEAIAGAEQEAASAKEEAAKAKKDAARAQAEAATATSRAEDESARARKELLRGEEETARAQEVLATAQEVIAKAKEETAEVKRQAAQLVRERDLAARRAEEQGEERKGTGTEIEKLLAKINVLCAERDAAQSRAEKLEQQVDGMQAGLAALRTQLDGRQAELADARNQLTSLAAERDTLHGLSGEQGRLIDGLRAEIATAKRAIPTPPDEVEVLDEVELVQEHSSAVTGTLEEAVSEPDLDFFDEESPVFPAFGESSDAFESAPEAGRKPESAPEESELQLATVSPSHAPKAEPAVTVDSTPAFDVSFGDFCSVDDRFFGSLTDESGASALFVQKLDQTAIEYSSPEDIVQLQKSYNVAQVALDGKGTEVCEGYVCCLRTNEQLQVFAAVYGTKSGKISVFAPEAQPCGPDGVAAAVAGAVIFHEQVGLMVEPLDLDSPLQRKKAIIGCPVLRLVSERAVSVAGPARLRAKAQSMKEAV